MRHSQCFQAIVTSLVNKFCCFNHKKKFTRVLVALHHSEMFRQVTIMKVYENLHLSWRKSLSYRNKAIDSQSKSMDWCLYDKDLCHARVKFSENNLRQELFHGVYQWSVKS